MRKIFTIVEETISINPDDFLNADRDLGYIHFCNDTESETDSDNDLNFFLKFKCTNFSKEP